MQKKTISFIGSGNIATYLAQLFYANGFGIQQICSRDAQHASALASFVNASVCTDVSSLNSEVDFILVAVSDSQIEHVISKITKPFDAFILHTAGSVDMNVFEKQFQNYGVLYPLQTFTKGVELSVKNFPFFVEGNNANTTESIIQLAKSISENVHEVNSQQRQTLHLAAVYTNNFINHLMSISKDIVEKEHINFELLQPLILETIYKAQKKSPDEIQTGPAKRNDSTTIQKHKELLQNYPPNFSFIYDAITTSIIEKNKNNG